MTRFLRLFLLSIFMLGMLPQLSFAQMDIDELSTDDREVKFRDTIKRDKIENEYFSLARYKAERKAIRKERNNLEILTTLQGSLTTFNDPWVATSGGDNTTALVANINVNHTYKRDKFTLTSKFAANLGYNRVKIETGKDDDGNTISEGVWYKNQDGLSLSTAPALAISPTWSYGMTFAFRTQFANGYVSRSQQEGYHLKSSFMAPGYLDISGGVTYKCPNKKLPFTINIAPLAMSAVYVNSPEVQENFRYKFGEHKEGAPYIYTEPYGVSPFTSSKYEGGSSVQIYFDRTFEKLSKIRYTTTIFSFYGWMTQLTHKNIVEDHEEYKEALAEWNKDMHGVKPILGIRPTVRWENTISIPATDILSTVIKFQLYYNKAQNVKIQTQTFLSVGLAYRFKNK